LTLRPTSHWVKVLNDAGVPAGEILSLEDALSAPQIQHRGTIQTVCEPEIGELKLFNLTAKFEKTPGTVDSPPPRLSAHTEEILQRLGYTREKIQSLREKGVI